MECPRVSGLAAVTFILLIAFALSSAFVLRHSKLVRRDHLSLPSLSPLSCAPGFPRLRPQFALPIELRRAQRSPSAVPLRSRKRQRPRPLVCFFQPHRFSVARARLPCSARGSW